MHSKTKQFAGCILGLVITGLLFPLMCSAAEKERQIEFTAASTLRGERLLFSKGCVYCHGINGTASDLSRTPRNAGTPEALAGEMWNHMPQMWAKTPADADTSLTSTEAADLFAYLYSTMYFAFPGSAARGQTVFQSRHCADCHSNRSARDPAAGSAISAWEVVGDPLTWTERMWNHSPDMNQAITQKGLHWPLLSSQDIADLLIYLRSIPELRAKSEPFRMGEPAQGRFVFERECRSCHSFGSASGSTVDFLQRPSQITVTGYIAAMWNHAPVMRSKSGEHFPVLGPGEMSDLVAFLFSQSYFLKRGNAVQGRFIFESKRCARCHEERSQETGAPKLTGSTEPYTPVALIAAVWRHGSAMSEMMRRNGLSWPRFNTSDMADLIAYLNSSQTNK